MCDFDPHSPCLKSALLTLYNADVCAQVDVQCRCAEHMQMYVYVCCVYVRCVYALGCMYICIGL